MIDFLEGYFCKVGKDFSKCLINNVEAIMQCGKASTHRMARQLSKKNGKQFKTNEMSIYRFLQDKEFQVDDTTWRCHIKMIFDLLERNNLIKKGEKIQINVDFTTHEDNFLILSASIILCDKAITIYFTMRNYPKKKDQYNHKKMEMAFIKGLRHVLSTKYSYVIVGDRGFGNQRFAKLCTENGFEYVLRMNTNLTIKVDGEEMSLKEKNRTEEFTAYVKYWRELKNFSIVEKDGKMWYLMSSNPENNAKEYYEKRFKIEKSYQDCKSSGYEIEKNKIRKYHRFKRMLYMVILSHALTCMLGYVINTVKNRIKKNYIHKDSINTNLILAFSGLDMKQFTSITKNPLISSGEHSFLN